MNFSFRILVNRVNKFLESFFGVRIQKVGRIAALNKDIPHSVVQPEATYSPWLSNDSFLKVYEVARKYTLVDQYRLFELYELARQTAQLGGCFVEVGVWRGGSSAVIEQAITDYCVADMRPKFYIADTFEGVVKAGEEYDSTYKGAEHSDTSIEHVKELFDKVNLKIPEILVGIFPDDHPDLNINEISFLHSDVDVYESTKDIVEWCLPRLTKNAVVVFDDYGFRSCDGVTVFVNDFMRLNGDDFFWLHNLNGHAVLIKK